MVIVLLFVLQIASPIAIYATTTTLESVTSTKYEIKDNVIKRIVPGTTVARSLARHYIKFRFCSSV